MVMFIFSVADSSIIICEAALLLLLLLLAIGVMYAGDFITAMTDFIKSKFAIQVDR